MIFLIVPRSSEVPTSVTADSVTVTEGGALIFRNITEVDPEGRIVASALVLAVSPQSWISVEPNE